VPQCGAGAVTVRSTARVLDVLGVLVVKLLAMGNGIVTDDVRV
jgi:hypothetical protein